MANSLMHKKALTLSIVILAYNEERYLGACLEAIANQTVRPDEVIVVDNNSTDGTAEVARGFGFVRLVREKVQGMIPARNVGFDKAKGDVLARIDADTVLEPDWCERLLRIFADKSVAGVSGPGYMQIAPFIGVKTTFWARSYHLGALSDFRFHVLWGGNMAVRSSVWSEVLPYLATRDRDVHEDLDISSALNMLGYKIRYDKRLLVTVDASRFWNMSKLIEYYLRTIKTRLRWRKIRATHHRKLNTEISSIESWLFRLVNFPFAVVFLLLSGFYSFAKLFSR